MSLPRRPGLTQEYPNPDDKKATREASADIIALHGLASAGPKQWMAWVADGDPKSGNIYWLKDNNMLPAVVPNCRILSYNWNGNYAGDIAKVRFIGEADTMLNRIDEERRMTGRSERPIIFIASCFGGLLLAKTLVRASDEFHPIGTDRFRRILDLTAGVVFLGTPFRGSWTFGYANAQAVIKLAGREKIASSQELVQYLRPDGRGDAGGAPSPLDEIVQRFTEMVKHDGFKFPVVCFYETEATKYDSYIKKLPEDIRPEGYDPTGHGLPVNEGSASIDGFERIALYRRHSMMTKYNSPDDDGFIRISQKIQGFADNASKTLSRKASQYRFATTFAQSAADYLKGEVFANKHDENYKKWEPGTCQSFQQSREFLAWKESPQGSTLFCPGIPGAGKTVFASSVINHFIDVTSQDRSSALAYVYCDYMKDKPDDKNRRSEPIQTAEYFLKSILKQLVEASTVLPLQVLERFEEMKQRQSQLRVNELEQAIAQMAATFSDVFIVVDALDECQLSEAKRFISVLFKIQNSLPVHLLVTSRFIDEIQELFKGTPYLPIQASQQDVALYVRNHIGDVSRVLDTASRELKEEVIDAISTYSDGMFLLAQLYLYSLGDKLKSTQIRAALSDIRNHHRASQRPRQEAETMELLTDAYERTLAMINSRQTGFRNLARKALMWVAFAFAPLTKAQLQEALAIEIGADSIDADAEILYDFPEINKACAGLLRVEQLYSNQHVRLAHHTTEAFVKANIDRIGIAKPTHHRLPTKFFHGTGQSISFSHRNLALLCVTYLIRARLDNDGNFMHTKRSRLLVYAKQFWYDHAAYITFGQDSEALFLVTKLLRDEEKTNAMGLDLGLTTESPTKGVVTFHFLVLCRLRELAEIMLVSPKRARALLTSTVDFRYTPLCWALICNPNLELVKLLLDKGADPEHISDCGPPLVLAAQIPSIPVVELLLERTTLGVADVFLFWVHKRYLPGITWLLQRNIVDPREKSKWAELYLAESRHSTKSDRNTSPLAWAQRLGYKDIEAIISERDTDT